MTSHTSVPPQTNNVVLGDDYWAKFNSILDAKIKVIEDKFDMAVSVLDTKLQTLEGKCAH